MSTSSLFKASGVAALLAGALLILTGLVPLFVEMGLPPYAFVVAHVFMLFALMGIYLREHSQTGILGFVGFVVVSVGNLFFTLSLFATNVVRPRVVEALVMAREIDALDVVDQALGSPPPGAALLDLPAFAVGLLILAVANLRASVLPRLALWVMAAGPILNLAVEPLGLPIFVGNTIAPSLLGLGTLWAGYSLWAGSGERSLQLAAE